MSLILFIIWTVFNLSSAARHPHYHDPPLDDPYLALLTTPSDCDSCKVAFESPSDLEASFMDLYHLLFHSRPHKTDLSAEWDSFYDMLQFDHGLRSACSALPHGEIVTVYDRVYDGVGNPEEVLDYIFELDESSLALIEALDLARRSGKDADQLRYEFIKQEIEDGNLNEVFKDLPPESANAAGLLEFVRSLEVNPLSDGEQVWILLCCGVRFNSWSFLEQDGLTKDGIYLAFPFLSPSRPGCGKMFRWLVKHAEDRKLIVEALLRVPSVKALARDHPYCFAYYVKKSPALLELVIEADLMAKIINIYIDDCQNTFLHAAVATGKWSLIKKVMSVSGIEIEAVNLAGLLPIRKLRSSFAWEFLKYASDGDTDAKLLIGTDPIAVLEAISKSLEAKYDRAIPYNTRDKLLERLFDIGRLCPISNRDSVLQRLTDCRWFYGLSRRQRIMASAISLHC